MADLKIDTYFEGRYPHKGSRMDRDNMTVEVQIYDDRVIFRLDDKENLDFWMQFSVSEKQLKEILRQMDHISTKEE